MTRLYKHSNGRDMTREEFIADMGQRYASYPDVVVLVNMIRSAEVATTGKDVSAKGFHFAPTDLEGIAYLMEQRALTSAKPDAQTNIARQEARARSHAWRQAAGVVRMCKLDLE